MLQSGYIDREGSHAMLGTQTPRNLLHRALNDLARELPQIREGTEEGFHQARVAIRRIREVLALLSDGAADPTIEAAEARLRRAARALGRVRDADVAQQLLHHVEARFPPATAAIGQLRRTLSSEQHATRRRAIKRLESLDLLSLSDELAAASTPHSVRAAAGFGWRAALRRQLAQRGADVRSAIDHAGGVYFPNRVHDARIAIKQLRYTLELAKATRTWRLPHALRALKQAQAALGEAHDRDVVLARLQDLPPSTIDTTALDAFLRAEIDAFHRTYLGLRPAITQVCDACARATSSRRAERWLLAASIAVPSLLFARRALTATTDATVERRLRIPVA